MKIRPVGAELFHADRGYVRTDGRTDMKKQIFALRNFANAPVSQHAGARIFSSAMRNSAVVYPRWRNATLRAALRFLNVILRLV